MKRKDEKIAPHKNRFWPMYENSMKFGFMVAGYNLLTYTVRGYNGRFLNRTEEDVVPPNWRVANIDTVYEDE